MSSYVKKLEEYLNTPKWMIDNIMFEGITGSVAYGVSTDYSDMDILGFCIPPKELVFPHLAGEIPGFGNQLKRFDVWQQHGIEYHKRSYDFAIYSIVKFFQLCMDNNPNCIDVLFLPRSCVLHSTQIYEHMRENRKIFLHKGCWSKFRGYAFSQFSKIRSKSNSSNPKRQESIENYGYDVKFGYHLVRLLLEVEQIMTEGDLDLQRNSDILNTIRNGEWTFERLENWFENKEKSLETLYVDSKLPERPKEYKIKQILMECLEMHYQDLSSMIKVAPEVNSIISDLEALVQKYKV
jgi:predicted nucleotidyltransferase